MLDFMPPQKSDALRTGSLSMAAITIPLFFETLFRILVQSIDTFMLAGYSSQAVAGSGLVGQYIFFCNILFNIICTGTSIIIAQYLGAKRLHESRQVAQASVILVSAIALLLTLAIILGTGPLLSLYTLETAVRDYAYQYMIIYGGFGAFFLAFSQLQGTILRAHGHARDAMVIAMIANVVNVLGNSFALYGWFGLPVTGVAGVAASSVLSQVVACLLLATRLRKHRHIGFTMKGWRTVPGLIYRRIASIGGPSAGESLSYNLASIVVVSFVSILGTSALAAQVYTLTLVRFVMTSSVAIGGAVQIKTGYMAGADKHQEWYRKLFRYQAFGTLVALASIGLLNLLKPWLIPLLSTKPDEMAMVSSLLVVSILVEFGRSMNLITISALKGAGDVRFPVYYGMFSMWAIMVLGAWFLGIQAGLGMVGIFLAIGLDETSRGFVMLGRWKSKRWMSKVIP